MLTEKEKKVVSWLRQKKVATMQQMRQRFDVSHMTIVRALSKHGYFTSYDHNASFYTLNETPKFDDWGLWTIRDIHFSKHGTFKNTLIVLVEKSPAGRTTRELKARLHGDVSHGLSRLVREGLLACQPIVGREVVYLAVDARLQKQQFAQRQSRVAPSTFGLPDGMAVEEVLAILRQMILSPKGTPRQWARELKTEHIDVSDMHVRRVIKHYALEKKRHI